MLIKMQIIWLLFYALFFSIDAANNMNKFMYFAYGSNMLAQRIHIQNPTAVRIGTGKLNVCYTYTVLKMNPCFLLMYYCYRGSV